MNNMVAYSSYFGQATPPEYVGEARVLHSMSGVCWGQRSMGWYSWARSGTQY